MEWSWIKSAQINQAYCGHNILLAYLYFRGGFKIRTSARDLQLVEVVSQEGKQVALYIRRLTKPQMRYMVI